MSYACAPYQNTPCSVFLSTFSIVAGPRCGERAESLDVDQMLLQSCGAMVVRVMKSTIEPEMTGIGCVSIQQFEKQIIMGYCSRMLMYANLYGDKGREMKYRGGVVSVNMREFHSYSVRTCKELKDSSARSQVSSIFPVQLSLRLVNDN